MREILKTFLLIYGIWLAIIVNLLSFISNRFADAAKYLDDAIGELDEDREKL